MNDTHDQLALMPSPLYKKVRDVLLDNIRSGEWIVGDALPNETNLAQRFGVSIGTIRRAITGLENDGLLKRIQGRGTFVAGFGSHVLKQKFTRLLDNQGNPVQPSYRLISTTIVCGPEDAHRALRLSNATKLLEICQEVLVEGSGVGDETSYIEADRYPGFQRLLSYGQHLYPALADFGTIVVHATEVISASCCAPGDRLSSNLPEGSPVLSVCRTALSMDKAPIEYRISRYDASKVSYASILA